MGANSSRRSVVDLESREQSIRESSPVRESESRLTAFQVSEGIKWHIQQYHKIRPQPLSYCIYQYMSYKQAKAGERKPKETG